MRRGRLHTPVALAALALVAACPAPAGAASRSPVAQGAFQQQLPVVLARLDRARLSDRLALRHAAGPAAQARVARRLAAAHLAAERALRPLAGRGDRPLLAALAGAAGAYGVLADASRSRAGFAAARGAVARSEDRLAAMVQRLVPARPAPRPTRTGDGPRVPLLALALAALLAGVALLRRGRPAPTVPTATPTRPPSVTRRTTPPPRPAPPPPPAPPARAAALRWDSPRA